MQEVTINITDCGVHFLAPSLGYFIDASIAYIYQLAILRNVDAIETNAFNVSSNNGAYSIKSSTRNNWIQRYYSNNNIGYGSASSDASLANRRWTFEPVTLMSRQGARFVTDSSEANDEENKQKLRNTFLISGGVIAGLGALSLIGSIAWIMITEDKTRPPQEQPQQPKQPEQPKQGTQSGYIAAQKSSAQTSLPGVRMF